MRCEVPLPLLGLLLCVGEWSWMGSRRDGKGLQGLRCVAARLLWSLQPHLLKSLCAAAAFQRERSSQRAK